MATEHHNPSSAELVHLRAAGVSLVLDLSGGQLPRILHWGTDLGPVDAEALSDLARASKPPIISGSMDEPAPLSLIPEASRSWLGTPGLTGHRDGADFSTRCTTEHTAVEQDVDGTQRVTTSAQDRTAGIALDIVIELTPVGLVRAQASVTNTGDGTYTLDGLLLALPLPAQATEILDFTGRHLRERSPQRHPLVLGTYSRESRRGRPGSDASLLLIAGEPHFGFRRGPVWAIHPAWSGNHRMIAERTTLGHGILAAGELLLPGEIRLSTGQRYDGPWIVGSYGDGLDAMSARFHDHLRARPHHPATVRPVIANTWEAMYFAQSFARVAELAEAAASVGAERFVLDDGWFHGRRDDSSALGDWYVDEEIWPDGLAPLADHVRGLGMEFGLWFEPEMVNPQSDLARAHPDWIMSTGDRLPPPARHQQVLDLTITEAYEHILDRISTLVDECAISYLKWDHNRDLVDAGHGPRRTAGVHEQTLAVYRMMDELRRRHPGLEIESCASGGSRVDLGILDRTDRIWTSDCVDAVERQAIQRWTGMLLPPELMGAHIGSPDNHSTGRSLHLNLRAATAFFYHLGIEWDVTAASAPEREQLATWIAAHKEHRELLHSGRVVHGDHPDPTLWVHGVVARNGSAAIYSMTSMASSPIAPYGRVCLPGLDPNATYQVRPLPPGEDFLVPGGFGTPAWWSTGVRLTGRVLGEVGVQLPTLPPQTAVLLQARVLPQQ